LENDSPIDTKRAKSRLLFVLVVHDKAVDAEPLCEQLRDLFIVREATVAFDALERLTGGQLACVVCMVGGAIRGKDFLQLVQHASPEHVSRLIIVDESAGRDAADFVRGTGATFLPSTDVDEVIAVVRAVSARA
jgi:CheY-like chemotaxis protein